MLTYILEIRTNVGPQGGLRIETYGVNGTLGARERYAAILALLLRWSFVNMGWQLMVMEQSTSLVEYMGGTSICVSNSSSPGHLRG